VWRARSAPKGSLGGQAQGAGSRGGNLEGLDRNVNFMASNLNRRRWRNIARSRPPSQAATCRRKITVDVRGDKSCLLKETLNTMVPSSCARSRRSDAAVRAARSHEGRLGGQAVVPRRRRERGKNLTERQLARGDLTTQVAQHRPR